MNKNGIWLVGIITIVTFALAGCGEEEYSFFAEGGTNDELNEALFDCLEREEVEYKLDDEENVLIKDTDVDTAVAKCT